MISRLIRIIFLAGITLSPLAQAAISGIQVTCTDPQNPDTCTVETIGEGAIPPSSQMLTFIEQLIRSTIDPTSPNPDCNLTVLGGTCSIPVEGTETQVTFGCNYDPQTQSMDCGLANFQGGISDAVTIGCNGQTNTCTFTTDSSKFIDLLPPAVIDQLPVNLAALVNSFLSCASQNTFGNLSTICSSVLSMIQSGNVVQAIQTIAAMQPLNPDASFDMANLHVRQAFNTIQERLSRLRNGIPAIPNATTRYRTNSQWYEAGTLLADAETTATDAAPVATETPTMVSVDKNISEYGNLGFFINMALINAEQDGDVELHSDSDASILTLGIDYRFTDNMIGGVAFNINQSDTRFEGSSATKGELESDGYSALLYSSFYYGDWFFDSSLTLGGDEYEQLREPTLLGNSYESRFHGDQQSLSLSSGYDIHIGALNMTPYAQLVKGKVSIDGYRETATNPGGPNTGATLQIDEQENDIGTLSLGSHFRWIFTTDSGVFVPVVSIAANKDLEDDAQVITGRFVGNTTLGGGFQMETNEVDTSYLVIGLGLSFQLKNGNAGFFNLETLEGYDNLDQQRITAGWRWEI